MKIAFISLGFQPYHASGLDISGDRLVSGLLAAGHEVTVFAGQKAHIQESVHDARLEIVRIPLGSSDWIGFGRRAAERISKHPQFDIVHFWDIHFGWAYHGYFVGSLQHSFTQRIASLGKLSPAQAPRFLYRYAYYSIARRFAEIPSINRAHGLLAGSETTRDEFLKDYKLSPLKVMLARHGIDTNIYHPGPDRSETRRRMGLPENRPIILFASFITPRKGLEYLVEALPQINPAPVLVVAGQWRDQNYRAKILHLMEPYQEQICEIGYAADSEMPGLFRMADIYVSPSLLEGFGLPVAEALACETPVVAVNAGAVAEVMGPGGILVPGRNGSALADAISSLLHDADRRYILGQAGRRHIEENFSLDTMLRDTLAGYARFA